MKLNAVSSLLFCALLAACGTTGTHQPDSFQRDPGITGPDAAPTDGDFLQPGTAGDPAPAPRTPPAPTPLPKVRDVPYATPEPGKTGLVRSPHRPEAGLIDVRGFPPGTEMKDPYAEGKSFLVP